MLTLKVLRAVRWVSLGGWCWPTFSMLSRPSLKTWAWADMFSRGLPTLSFLVYLLSFWCASDPTRSRAVRQRWSVVLTGAALVLNAAFPSQQAVGALLVAGAAILPMHFNLTHTFALIIAQCALLFAILDVALGSTLAWHDTVWAFGMESVLALGMSFVFHHMRSRQQGFASTAYVMYAAEHRWREAERRRIARDLHDVVGYNLTLLNLELEVARAQQDPTLRASMQRAHVLAARLNEDLRGTVSELRRGAVGWGEVVRPLDVVIPGLTIHLALRTASPLSEQTTHALALLVQEALTNTVRHAGATHFHVEVGEQGDGVQLRAWDDGAARGPVTPGHGLGGMRERIEAVGGTLTLRLSPGRSVCVEARVPFAEDTA